MGSTRQRPASARPSRPQTSRGGRKARPDWDDSKTDLKGMKLSKAELAMKKEAMRSGNNVTLPPDAVHSEWADFSNKMRNIMAADNNEPSDGAEKPYIVFEKTGVEVGGEKEQYEETAEEEEDGGPNDIFDFDKSTAFQKLVVEVAALRDAFETTTSKMETQIGEQQFVIAELQEALRESKADREALRRDIEETRSHTSSIITNVQRHMQSLIEEFPKLRTHIPAPTLQQRMNENARLGGGSGIRRSKDRHMYEAPLDSVEVPSYSQRIEKKKKAQPPELAQAEREEIATTEFQQLRQQLREPKFFQRVALNTAANNPSSAEMEKTSMSLRYALAG